MAFRHRPQNQSQHGGRRRNFHFVHEVPDNAEEQHDADIEEVVRHCVGADDAQQENAGDKNRLRNRQHFREYPDASEPHDPAAARLPPTAHDL